ncbi:MAG TPA: glycosyltransferase [Acidimicrobiales bacterium]|nr:glycosyltransferase [Acidimicrobiales bacterium]
MSSPFRAEDLVVVIPTRERWGVLPRALDALDDQTASGFHTVVVADGEDQAAEAVAPRARVTVTGVPRGGPGPARNAGVEWARREARPLALLLGDDILATPDLVGRHLDAHNRRPEGQDAVLGLIRWHPDAERGRIQRWLEWSGTQFDYAHMQAGPAGWSRFYSSNVSFKTELFARAGGFDPAFRFLYEDLDLGWRMEQEGMRLWYEPDAVGLHLHRYDWPGLRRRFETAGRAEHVMTTRHPWFEPWFLPRCREALATRPPNPLWRRVVDWLPRGPLRDRGRAEANRWYHLQLAPFFLNAWESERDFGELRAYLGDRFEEQRLYLHDHAIEAELDAAPDEETFYRTSEAYLYDLTAFAAWSTKVPYRAAVRRYVPAGSRLLDYGSGIGTDGLRLIGDGYRVDFADFDNPSTRYLRWRLQQRGLEAEVFDVDGEVPGGYDLVYSFDVIEHVEDPFAFLAALESRGRLVAVNFLEPDPGDPHMHRELPIPRLLDHAAERGLVRYRVHHGRSHFVVYGGQRGSRSRLERRAGPVLSRAWPGRAPCSAGGACWRSE